jgi:hypothetical protein
MKILQIEALPGAFLNSFIQKTTLVLNNTELSISKKELQKLIKLTPPRRSEFESQEDYESAYSQFWAVEEFEKEKIVSDFPNGKYDQVECFFNDCKLTWKIENGFCVTTAEEVLQQWEDHQKENQRKYEEWLQSKEGIAQTKLEEEARERRKEALKARQIMIEHNNFKFSEGGEEKWKMSVEKNTDPYGKEVLDFAKAWAIYMEEELSELTKDIMENCSKKADVGGITGFMYGAAVSVLSECWKYGEELRKIHNKEHNQSEEGVANSAIITITNSK